MRMICEPGGEVSVFISEKNVTDLQIPVDYVPVPMCAELPPQPSIDQRGRPVPTEEEKEIPHAYCPICQMCLGAATLSEVRPPSLSSRFG